jgi:hypothetical protein
MTDHPKQSDPRGVNQTGQGPAQPRTNVGAAVNTPQHLVGEQPAITEGRPDGKTGEEGKTRQTGVGTADPSVDVADPHPANEEHPYRARRPGGAHPPAKDLGPNPAIHDGTAPKRPHNEGSGPR